MSTASQPGDEADSQRYRKQFVVDEEAVTLEILDTAGQGTSIIPMAYQEDPLISRGVRSNG